MDVVRHTVPDNVHQLHVQQPSTYEKPEAASAVLGSWWWAVCRPKHVDFQKIWNNKSLIHCCILLDCFLMNCAMMHGSTNVKFHALFPTLQISNSNCNETARHALKNRAELNGNLMTHFESCILHRAEISWKLQRHQFYEFQCRRGFYEDSKQYIMAPPSFRWVLYKGYMHQHYLETIRSKTRFITSFLTRA